MEHSTDMHLGLGLPQYLRWRALWCCRGHRFTSALTHNLVIKYNDFPIFFVEYKPRCILFDENKYSSAQFQDSIVLLPSSNRKGLVLVQWHTPLMMLNIFSVFNFCFPLATHTTGRYWEDSFNHPMLIIAFCQGLTRSSSAAL